MRTLKISNGDIDTSQSTGLTRTVSGLDKGNQDVARHLLCAFNSHFSWGNELLGLLYNGNGIFSEAIVAQYIYACINRLIVIQQTSGADQRVIQVTQVQTRLIGLSTVVFLVEVLFANGQTTTIVDVLGSPQPVQLNQLLSPDATTGV